MSAHPSSANPWLPYRKPRPAAEVRLFCFPYAGGAASIFRTWGDALPPEIEVVPVQPPGREGRIRERPATSMAELVAAMDAGFGAELDTGRFAFFGHSLGATAAFELARRRRDAGRSEPRHLFASAHLAPPAPWLDEPITTCRTRASANDCASSTARRTRCSTTPS